MHLVLSFAFVLSLISISRAFTPRHSLTRLHGPNKVVNVIYNNKYHCKSKMLLATDDKTDEKGKSSNPFDAIASAGLAGVLAIAVAEAFFWAAGVPIANIYFKLTEGDWLDLSTQEGQLRAAGFSFGYGTFATAVLQYRVTIAAIPLIPIMQKYVVTPGKKYFGEKFGSKE